MPTIFLQVGAIISGIQPGLTMVVGPPGTGKTDTAVQILNVLYHNCPSQRTLIITHSNQALNDLFEKIMEVLLASFCFCYHMESYLMFYMFDGVLRDKCYMDLFFSEGCTSAVSTSFGSR